MLREYLAIAGMLGVEALVVAHWFLLPHNAVLGWVALGAGGLMTAMAVLSLLALVDVVRRRADDPQHWHEMADLAEITPRWVFVVVTQLAFVAAALLAGVLWIAVVVGVGQGAEVAAVALARLRTRGAVPAAGTMP